MIPPKDKAMELMLRYYELIPMNTVSFAKQCALIAVDELINFTLPSSEFGGSITDNTVEYWKEVKQYIIEI
jgi:hypothetical protein